MAISVGPSIDWQTVGLLDKPALHGLRTNWCLQTLGSNMLLQPPTNNFNDDTNVLARQTHSRGGGMCIHVGVTMYGSTSKQVTRVGYRGACMGIPAAPRWLSSETVCHYVPCLVRFLAPAFETVTS